MIEIKTAAVVFVGAALFLGGTVLGLGDGSAPEARLPAPIRLEGPARPVASLPPDGDGAGDRNGGRVSGPVVRQRLPGPAPVEVPSTVRRIASSARPAAPAPTLPVTARGVPQPATPLPAAAPPPVAAAQPVPAIPLPSPAVVTPAATPTPAPAAGAAATETVPRAVQSGGIEDFEDEDEADNSGPSDNSGPGSGSSGSGSGN